jgi:Rrf2 family transcriptional regulator, nitric oxide-sensitive transcriptional repressor
MHIHCCGPRPDLWRMRLTVFTDYSLRVLMYLAAQPGRRATIAEIAAAFDISQNHLTKVAHGLGRGGWLANVRGKGGGLALAMAPADIVIGAVVRHAEGGDVRAACFAQDGPGCAIAPACRLRGVLGEAVDAFHAVLDGCTLADLTARPRTLSRLLRIEPTARRDAPQGSALHRCKAPPPEREVHRIVK